MLQVLRWVLLAVEIVFALPILYLCVVTVFAMLSAGRHRKQKLLFAPPYAKFALLVPAHNEIAVLGNLLESLRKLDYPVQCYSVCVVADNCTDTTAELARASGHVRVYERFDQEKRGKGFALNWLLQQLEQDQLVFDAYVILDADAVVDAAFLQVMNYELARGAQALQAHYSVLNAMDSASTILRWLALSLVNYVRPLGRTALGSSSTLTGNGMCLSRALLQRHPWQAFGLAEDYQYYLHLVQHGEKVRFVPEAQVSSEMPATFEHMRTQDVRWEASQGAPPTSQSAWRLLRAGLRQRDLVRLEALAELITPPLSTLIAGCLLLLVGSLLLWSLPDLLVALLITGGLIYYTGSAFVLLPSPPPLKLLQALLAAPRFILWKLWVVLVLKRGKKSETEWIRTSRNASLSGRD